MEDRFLKSFKQKILHKTYLNAANLTQLNKFHSTAMTTNPAVTTGNLIGTLATSSKIRSIAPLKTEFTNRVER